MNTKPKIKIDIISYHTKQMWFTKGKNEMKWYAMSAKNKNKIFIVATPSWATKEDVCMRRGATSQYKAISIGNGEIYSRFINAYSYCSCFYVV